MIVWLARSVMASFYPRSAHFPGIEDMDLDGYIGRYRRETAPIMWLGFVLGVVLFHLTPLITVFIPLPAFWLSAAQRERHAQKLCSHPVYYLRQPIFLVKMVAGLLWGADPRVRERLGLPAYGADPGTRRLA